MTGPVFADDCSCGHRVRRPMPGGDQFQQAGGVWVRCGACGTPVWCPMVDGAHEQRRVAEVDG